MTQRDQRDLGDQLGVRALRLLAEELMVPVLWALAAGAVRPAELEQSLPNARHSAVIRRLRRLLESGLATYTHRPGVPPRARSAGIPQQAHYALTDAGLMLLPVTLSAVRWEESWRTREPRRQPELLAIRLLADRHTRTIALELADGSLAANELDQRVAGLGRSALRRRLRELALDGLLERSAHGRGMHYGLTAAMRHLALVAALAGRWEWRWSRLERPPHPSELIGLVRVLAPAAHVADHLAGVCQLHIGARTRGSGADLYLRVRDGRVQALPDAPDARPDAIGRGSAEAWCETLIAGNRPIAVGDGRSLLLAVIDALSSALRA